MTSSVGELTLTEVSRLLEEPQHRLIYLCEKGVIRPDLQDAGGRGSSRRFSERNLLEFAVALRLRDLELPVGTVAAVVYVLRAFEVAVQEEVSEFRLPDSLRSAEAPDLRVVISDGRRLYFTLGHAGRTPQVYGGIDLEDLDENSLSRRQLQRQLVLVEGHGGGQTVGQFGEPEGSRHARVEVSVTRIAQDLPHEA